MAITYKDHKTITLDGLMTDWGKIFSSADNDCMLFSEESHKNHVDFQNMY